MERIFIAGGTGTNGRALIQRLVDRPVHIKALVRDAARARRSIPESVELVEGDLSAVEPLAQGMVDCHRAYIVTGIMPDTVQWFDNFIKAAQQAGVQHLVKFSGFGVAPDADSVIIRQHWESDELVRHSGLDHTILRPNSFFENMLWLAGTIKREGRFYLPVGDAAQSMISVGDIAEVTADVLTSDGHSGQIYELTGSESLTYFDVAGTLSEVIGRPVEYIPVTPEATREGLLAAGVPDWNATALAEIQALFGTGVYARTSNSVTEILGRPPTTFSEWATQHRGAFLP